MYKKSKAVRGGLLAVASILLASVIASAVGFLQTQSTLAQSAISSVASDYGVTFNKASELKVSDISLKWINARTIEVSFTKKPDVKLLATADNEDTNDYNSTNDQRNADDQANYTIEGWPANCHASIDFSKSMDRIVSAVNVDIDFSKSPAEACVDGNELKDVPIANANMSIAYFRWVDAGKIESAGETFPGTFLQVSPTADSEIFIKDGQGPGCTARLVVNADKTKLKYYNVGKNGTKSYNGNPDPSAKLPSDCKFSTQRNNDDDDQDNSGLPINNVDLFIADVANNKLASGTGSSSASTGSVSETPSCELSGSPISWIICPIITLGLKVVTSIFSNLIEPYLQDTGITTDPTTPFYKAWANFRTIGNILLLFGLLFLVFGQSIGGGLVDAYTAKKLLPKVLIAAITINLSIYLVAIANDIVMVLGVGIGTLITAPFKEGDLGGNIKFSGGVSSALGFGALGFLLYKGVGAVGRFKNGGWFSSEGQSGLFKAGGRSDLGTEIMGLVITVVIPVFLITLAVVGTIIIRNGIVMITAIVAPVAIALMVIPGTEKYFKKWRELFFSSLIVYPIIIVFFALGNIMSSVILTNNEGSTFGNIIAIVALFAPMVMIPFAFKFAGGAMAATYGAINSYGNKAKAGIYGNEKDPHSFRNKWLGKRDMSRAARRETAYYAAKDRRDQITGAGVGAGIRRRAGKLSMGAISQGQNVAAVRSARAAAAQKEFEDQKNYGDDTEQRALTVNKAWAIDQGVEDIDWKIDDKGVRQFRTLGGAWVSESSVDAAHARWGRDISYQQQALSYEMSKATTQQEVDRVVSRVGATTDGWGMSGSQKKAAWAGAKFANQNNNLQFKYMSIGDDGSLTLDGRGLLTEVDEKRGSYQMSQQNADTWTSMRETVEEAKQVLTNGTTRSGGIATATEIQAAQEVIERAKRVANSNEVRAMAARVPDGDDAGAPIGGGSGAPGRVQQEINEFLSSVSSVPTNITTPTGPAVFRSDRPISPSPVIDPTSGEIVINPNTGGALNAPENPGNTPNLKPPDRAV